MKLIIQPDAAVVPIVQSIRQAKKQIDVCIFRLDVDEIEHALAAAVQGGVRVRALIAHTNRGGENRLRKLEQRLLAAGVTVTRTADDLLRYHAKYMVADNVLHLYGFNFTKLDMLKSRSFAVATRDRKAVADALRLFEADSTRQTYVPARSNLVVSPETSRDSLSRFIRGARRELAIYDVNVSDPAILKLLQARARAGVRIRILGSMKKESPDIEVRKFKPMRLHVRAMMRDGAGAFVGSQSLRKEELDSRREVGLIVTNPTLVKKMQQVFEEDWLESASKGDKHEGSAEGDAVEEGVAFDEGSHL